MLLADFLKSYAVVDDGGNVSTIGEHKDSLAVHADAFAVGQAIGKPTYIAWAVKKGNSAALEMINGALLDLRKSGEMYQMQKKWFGASFESMPQSVN